MSVFRPEFDSELKSNHLGRSTHVGDATVRHQGSGTAFALFRCTQMIL